MGMRSRKYPAALAGAFAGLSVLASGGAPVAAQEPGGATFEALLGKSTPSVDLGTLMAPFVDDCSAARRSIDRSRCEGINRFLKTAVPGRTFSMAVNDPESVSVSDYDARIKGVSVGVVGCLACDQPVKIGSAGQMRMVTLRQPDKSGGSLRAAVEVSRVSLTFGGIPESKVWLENVRPHLRAEFVFQPEHKEWSFGPARGIAFKMLGARVFNHCTGEVVFSQPSSSGGGPKYSEGRECREGGGGQAVATDLPAQLDAVAINRGMAAVKATLDACLENFKLRGSANLRFEVSGATGVPLSVVLEGSLGGTALGTCLVEEARKARFSPFKRETQKFAYPVMLRRLSK